MEIGYKTEKNVVLLIKKRKDGKPVKQSKGKDDGRDLYTHFNKRTKNPKQKHFLISLSSSLCKRRSISFFFFPSLNSKPIDTIYIYKLIRRDTTLGWMCPTLDSRCEENVTRRE